MVWCYKNEYIKWFGVIKMNILNGLMLREFRIYCIKPILCYDNTAFDTLHCLKRLHRISLLSI